MSDDDHATDSIIAPSFEQVQQRFESWRQRRKNARAFPWKAAVTLSEKYSIFYPSKALRVNYSCYLIYFLYRP